MDNNENIVNDTNTNDINTENENIVKDLVKERNDGVKLYRSYSVNGYDIKKEGTSEVYSDAIDVETADFKYTEVIPPKEDEDVKNDDNTVDNTDTI